MSDPNMDLNGRVYAITGGALGIGRCLTEELTRRGARVALIDKEADTGRALAEQLKREGGNVHIVPGDVAEEEALQSFVRRTAETFGGVDVLVNNACLHRQGLLTPCGYEDFNYVLRVGVTAPYMLTRLFLPYFRKGASVINITSTRAFMSQADTESYSAAKGGISALTHAMAVSLAGRVRVNAIAPGWIDTGAYHDPAYRPDYTRADAAQHPSGRVGTPQDIFRAVLFLSDGENSFIDGETLTVDGGMTRRMIYTGDEGWAYTV